MDFIMDEYGKWHYIKAFMEGFLSNPRVETFCGDIIEISNWDNLSTECYHEDLICNCATNNSIITISEWK